MKILYVEDEIAHVELTQRTLEDNLQANFVLLHAESLQNALKILGTDTEIDLVLSDLRLPDGSGLDLLKRVKEFSAPPAVVLVTGQGDEQIAVTALKAGAADYLVKQSDYLHRLPVVLSNAVAQNRLAREQAALREAQARFRTLVEQIPAAVYTDLADQKNTRVYISPQIEAISGYAPQVWLENIEFTKTIIHPEDKDRFLEADELTNQTGEPFNLEYRIICKDGQVRSIHDMATLVLDGQGNPMYWQGLLFDITKERESQQTILASEERFRRIFHSTPIPTCVVTVNEGRFIDANQAFQSLVGITLEKLVGHTSVEFGLWQSAQARSDFIVKLKEQGTIKGMEIPFPNVPDGPKDTLGFYELIELGGEPCLLAMFYEVTEQKKTQKALERQVKELTALHAVATAEAEGITEDAIIEKVTLAISQIYTDVCGILLLDATGQILTPHPSYFGANISNWKNGYPITEGITGRAISTGKIIRIGNIKNEPGYIEIASGVISEICVPIRVHERIIGVINIESKSADAFTEHDAGFLTTVASGLGNTLEKLRLFDEEQRRARELDLLYQATRSMTQSFSPEIIGQNLLSNMENILGYEYGWILLWDETNQQLVPLTMSREAYLHGTYQQDLEYIRNLNIKPGQGIIGWAIQNGKAVRSGDVTKDSRYMGLRQDIRSELCVPLLIHDKAIGVIDIESTKINAYSEKDENLLSALASSAAIALENARLFESEKQRRQEAETLRQAASAISSTLELDAVVTEILAVLKQVIPYDSGSVFFHEGNQLRIAMARGFPNSDQLKNMAFSADDELFQIIKSTGRPVIIEDVLKDTRFKSWGVATNIRGWMAVPLVTRGHVIGYITLDSHKPGTYNESIGETAMAFAYQAAAATDNARLYDETQRRLREMEIINRVSTSLRLAQSLDEILPILLDETLQLINTPHGSIWLFDTSNNVLTRKIAKGADAKIEHTSLKPGEGIVGHVFLSTEKYIAPDLANDPLLFTKNRESTTPGLSGICIPVLSTVGPMGVLMVSIDKERQLSGEINLLTILAEITGNAIHRAELFEQGQEQIRRLTTLRDIDSAIASSTDLRVTLNILMDHTLKHLKIHAVAIMLYHPELQSLTYLCSAGFDNPSPSRPLMRLGEGLAGQVVMKGSIEHVTDLQASNEVKRDPMLTREGFVTYFGIPLIVKGQIKGVFEIFHRAPFTATTEWTQFLQTLAGQAAIAIDNAQLFEHLQRSNQEVTQAYDTTLEGWARALELRDRETEGHTRRVTDLTMQLARHMGISDDELINMYRGVLLHDIGKMGVPDQILRKTGPLIESEWAEMRKHPEYAFNLLAPIPYLRPALDIPYCHHEHWDGSGYPRGLKGEQIPLSARIFSIVDIWDALLSDRSYRKAWDEPRVIEYLKEISGTILDPRVVTEFFKMIGVQQ